VSRFTDARLRIALSQQQSLLIKTCGWWRPRAVAETHCEAELPTINEHIQQQTWKGLRTEVTLCDSWARYFIVEPVKGLRSFSEFKRYAAVCFEEKHGLAAADWQIEADWQTGVPMLGVALPKKLLHGIKEGLHKAGNTLLAIDPFFVNIYNQCFRRIQHRSVWLLAIAPQHATLGLVMNGQWRGIRSTHIDVSAPVTDVERLIQRCQLQFGLTHDVPMVFLPAHRNQDQSRDSGGSTPSSMYQLALSRCRP